MKTRLSAGTGEQGNLILVAMIIGGIAGLTLASYLMLAQHQNVSIYRSQTWNSSLVVAEAGIEDGLQMINLYAGSFEPSDLYKWTNAAPGSGWERVGPNAWHTRRTITNGIAPGRTPHTYEAWIFNTNNMPAVYCEGTVPWTGLASAQPQAMVAQAGSTATTFSSRQSSITRKVLVNTHFEPLFIVAMAALGTIDLKGKKIQSDSFDSGDPRYSINHFYPTNHPEMTKDNGDIATDSAIVDSMNLGNAHLRGHVRTGPGTNTFGWQNPSVGDRGWVESNTPGIQEGYSSTDFNVIFNEVKIPTDGWLNTSPSPYTTNGVTYDYHFSSEGRYSITGLTGSVLVDAPTNQVVELRIGPDDVRLASKDIRIAPTGCKLYIYMWGNSFSLTGTGRIDNQSGQAQNFYLFGASTCREIVFGGNASFTGAIYAPQAAFSLGGGGPDTYDFVGASVTASVMMNGHFNFHFDENLAKVGPGQGYLPVGWVEL